GETAPLSRPDRKAPAVAMAVVLHGVADDRAATPPATAPGPRTDGCSPVPALSCPADPDRRACSGRKRPCGRRMKSLTSFARREDACALVSSRALPARSGGSDCGAVARYATGWRGVRVS